MSFYDIYILLIFANDKISKSMEYKPIENKSKRIAARVKLLGDIDRLKFWKFYHHVEMMNENSDGHFPLDDDWDKKWDVKNFILDRLEYDDNKLLIELTEFVLELDLITMEISKYFCIHDGRIVRK